MHFYMHWAVVVDLYYCSCRSTEKQDLTVAISCARTVMYKSMHTPRSQTKETGHRSNVTSVRVQCQVDYDNWYRQKPMCVDICVVHNKNTFLHLTIKFLIHFKLEQVSEFRGDIPQLEKGREVQSSHWPTGPPLSHKPCKPTMYSNVNTTVICREIILQNHGIPKTSSYTVQNHNVPKRLCCGIIALYQTFHLPSILLSQQYSGHCLSVKWTSKWPQRWVSCWQALTLKVK